MKGISRIAALFILCGWNVGVVADSDVSGVKARGEARSAGVDEDKLLLDAALRRRDWATALPVATRLAVAGDAEAQGVLGIIYYDGLSVDRDREQAAEWLEKAVASGFKSAETLLGWIYFELNRYQAARPLLEGSAASGNSVSMLLLSSLYGNGLGVERDPAKRMRWLVKSGPRNQSARETIATLFPVMRPGTKTTEAARRSFRAFFASATRSAEPADVLALGELYERGAGVVKDLEAALQWYAIAARQGDPQGHFKVAELARELSAGGNTLTHEALTQPGADVSGARRETTVAPAQLALWHYYAAAKARHLQSTVALARAYLRGTGVEQDVAKAYIWWSLADLELRHTESDVGESPLVTQLEELNHEIVQKARAQGLSLVRAKDTASSHHEARTLPPQPAASAPVKPGKRFVVDRASVNLRATPGTGAAIVLKLRRGAELREQQRAGDWIKVEVHGENRSVGWVYAPLLRERGARNTRTAPVAASSAGRAPLSESSLVWRVRAAVVNMRAGPGREEVVKHQLSRGQRVVLEDESGDWVLAQTQQSPRKRGWVYKSLLETAPPPGAAPPAIGRVATGKEGAARWTVVPRLANVRGGPGLEFPTVAQVGRGAAVVEVSRDRDWLEVRRAGAASALGWMSRRVLKRGSSTASRLPVESIAGAAERIWVVAADSANVRAGPSTAEKTVHWVQLGTVVKEIERSGSWVRVEILNDAGGSGWVYARSLERRNRESRSAIE